MSAFFLNDLGIVCALGAGRDAVAKALFATDAPQGVAVTEALTPGRPLALGRVTAGLPDLGGLPAELRGRNNALLQVALAQIRPAVDAAIARHGAHRVGLGLGPSTSGAG